MKGIFPSYFSESVKNWNFNIDSIEAFKRNVKKIIFIIFFFNRKFDRGENNYFFIFEFFYDIYLFIFTLYNNKQIN